jgi:hypothetical protein
VVRISALVVLVGGITEMSIVIHAREATMKLKMKAAMTNSLMTFKSITLMQSSLV